LSAGAWLARLALATTLAACAAEPPPPPAPPPAPAPPALPPASCATSEASPAPEAEALAHARIALVCFAGRSRLKEATLRPLITVRDGQSFDADAVAADLRRLFASGEIDDVQARATASAEGVVLTYALAERKLVAGVRFEGLHAMSDDDARTAFHAADLKLLDPAAVRAGVERLRSEYKNLSYLYPHLSARTTLAGEGVELTIEVDEGPAVVVSSLVFPGAHTLPERDLQKLSETKAGAPYRSDLFERDVLIVNAAYYDHGMLQVNVGPAEITPSADKLSVAIRVPVTEGPVFRIHALAVAGDTGGTEKEIRALIPQKVGDVFDRAKMIAGIDAIKALLEKRGVKKDVEPQTELDPAKRWVSLTFVVR
jgi:outer membrane protein insertion porin family